MKKTLLIFVCVCLLGAPARAGEDLFLPQERAYLVKLYQ